MREVFVMPFSAPASIRHLVRRLDVTTSGRDPDDGVLRLDAQAEDDGIALGRERCFIHSNGRRYAHDRTIVPTCRGGDGASSRG